VRSGVLVDALGARVPDDRGQGWSPIPVGAGHGEETEETAEQGEEVVGDRRPGWKATGSNALLRVDSVTKLKILVRIDT